ncbi:MAG: phosphatase PAP2 family protein [Chloroflexales bacterium]|nr:phosphatase PAP2 family protein [Chloroflexales bacterium]
MELMSLLGEEGVILTAVIGSILLALRRSWGILALWVATIGGSIILNRLMKGQFQTVRSAVGHPEFVEVSTGFPSGHTMMALATYGLLAYLLSQRSHDRRQALLIFAASGLMIGLISLSRLYLLTHYLSDVLGGAAGGMAWLALCIGLFSLLSATRGTERRNGRRRPARA